MLVEPPAMQQQCAS